MGWYPIDQILSVKKKGGGGQAFKSFSSTPAPSQSLTSTGLSALPPAPVVWLCLRTAYHFLHGEQERGVRTDP